MPWECSFLQGFLQKLGSILDFPAYIRGEDAANSPSASWGSVHRPLHHPFHRLSAAQVAQYIKFEMPVLRSFIQKLEEEEDREVKKLMRRYGGFGGIGGRRRESKAFL